MKYFTDGITSHTLETIGAEIETQFVDKNGFAITTKKSQAILTNLTKNGWEIDCRKGDLITTLIDQNDNKIFYELGRHNIEVATAALKTSSVLNATRKCLNELYEAASSVGAKPYFAPILNSDEDLLVIPDERDATWLELDGRSVLAPLARTSSVQFTISVAPKDAIAILNKFGGQIDSFLTDFPQDAVWKEYIKGSSAGYLHSRYGGPLTFESLENYCLSLAKHDVVQGARLVPLQFIDELDVSLFLRSIWWHFRLKRYGNALCIEVRPMARREDTKFQFQLEKVIEIFCA